MTGSQRGTARSGAPRALGARGARLTLVIGRSPAVGWIRALCTAAWILASRRWAAIVSAWCCVCERDGAGAGRGQADSGQSGGGWAAE